MPKPLKEKIVFLDAATVDYGDLSLAGLRKLGHFQAFATTSHEDLEAHASGATVLITNKCVLDRKLLAGLSGLKLVCVTATGVNNIDLEGARKAGIAVTNVPGYSTETVVQCTFAFLLALAGNLVPFNKVAQDGTWSRSEVFTMGTYPLTEIHGKVLGLVGLGAIGRRVKRVAEAFGMKVLAARIPGRCYTAAGKKARLPLEEVVRKADFLTLHAPLTPLTRSLIDGRIIRKMKPSACLINMARGGIVDESALRQALEEGRLAGAASDVLTQEPPPESHILLGAPRLLLTPHVAWASREARARLMREVELNIRGFFRGRKRNRIV